MQRDIYKDIERFTLKLDEIGQKRYAQEIRDAVASGSMASEILGLVSLELKKAHNVLPKSEEFLIKTADQLLSDINKILGFG